MKGELLHSFSFQVERIGLHNASRAHLFLEWRGVVVNKRVAVITKKERRGRRLPNKSYDNNDAGVSEGDCDTPPAIS
jgi:hypothetical protein